MLEHFGSALQVGLTATPRELEEGERALTDEEKRRDTQHYFGDPVFTYSLKQAIEDGYLVPYLLEERITNVDEEGYTGPDGKRYTTSNFEREIRMPDRTRAIAEDLWETLGKYQLRNDKTIVFCVDDTHASFMAQELRRLSGDNDYAARITRAERNSHQLERNFAVVGPSNPRVAVTVDLLTTGFDAPDVKNVVFVRPLRSAILYKQMKGRGTRLCEDINKRYFIIARIKECTERVKEIEELKRSSRMQQQYLSASLIESELHPDFTGNDGWIARTVGQLVTTVRTVPYLGWLVVDDDRLLQHLRELGARLRSVVPDFPLLATSGRAVRFNSGDPAAVCFSGGWMTLTAEDERRGKNYRLKIERQEITSRLGVAGAVTHETRVSGKLGESIYGLVNNDATVALENLETIKRVQRTELKTLLASVGLRLLIRQVEGVPELTIPRH